MKTNVEKPTSEWRHAPKALKEISCREPNMRPRGWFFKLDWGRRERATQSSAGV
jgi:hypothetical protein